MKLLRFSGFLTLLVTLLLADVSARTPTEPKITSVSIQGTNIIVKVTAPAGLRKITVETRARLEASTWAPKALKRFETPTTAGQEITFELTRSDHLEVLRVRADETDPLPTQFFKGTNQFAGPQSTSGAFQPPAPNGTFPGDATGSPEQRSVVESDIWKVTGDTLYFFNNLRGLQVIDISNPDTPTVKGTFSVPASGEQMYVLPSGHAVLLTRNWCNSNGSDESRILIVDGSSATPTLAAETTVPGWIAESRMVGSALYIISQTYYQRQTDGTTFWEPRTALTSIDLANPAAPVRRSSANLAGYTSTIYANDHFLIAARWNYQPQSGSELQIVDISSPTGEFSLLTTLLVAGGVPDKFKMNIDGDILTVISHSWNDTTRWVTTLENFSLSNPKVPVKVGSLKLAEGEQLHATRFDGKRAYIVTFFRIDPLWIVDLTDPAHPNIAGELQVPGWSTYLQPLGDRVLALGIDDTNSWRVAVSLFDVANPAAPKLLSKIPLGQNSSWSEANYDEKALTVLTDAGLVLVPYTGYTTNGQSSHVQLIDLAKDSLTRRGEVSDQLYPRRATLHREHIVSISGRELVSYDAANRDQPVLKARVDLSWPVDRVLLSGDYLLEFENGASYYFNTPAVIRVANANNPEVILASVVFTNSLPIAGAEIRDGKLYVAQTRGNGYGVIFVAVADASGNVTTNEVEQNFLMTIWDLTQLPNLTKISEATAPIGEGLTGALAALWPKPNLLVWSGGGRFNNWWWGGPVAMDAVGAAPVDFWWGGWWGFGGSGGRLAAFDVSAATQPAFKSYIDLTTNDWWNFSKPVLSEGLVYLSHQRTETIQMDPPPPSPDPTTNTTTPGWGNGTNITIFVTRYFLDVIDYSDAANPVIRKPVNIPGTLQGVSHQGGVLYTVGNHFDANGQSNGGEWLDASAYDGVAAYLIDSLSLTNWPYPVEVQEPDIFLGRPTSLERWQLSVDGMFQNVSTTATADGVYDIHFFGDLLALTTNARILLYDATNRGALTKVGESSMACHGADLDNSDGALTRGLWIPQSDYGVLKVNTLAH